MPVETNVTMVAILRPRKSPVKVLVCADPKPGIHVFDGERIPKPRKFAAPRSSIMISPVRKPLNTSTVVVDEAHGGYKVKTIWLLP